MSNVFSQSLPLNDSDQSADQVEQTTHGHGEEVEWQVVAKTFGLTPATIIAGRLNAEGIPARAWQEGAGQALGLTVGLLGTGYVVVPEELSERAKQILADAEIGESGEPENYDSQSEETS